MAHAVIRHSLGLVLRLLDSATGNEISNRNAAFVMPAGRKGPIAKGGGVFLFLETGRKDFELEVHVHGYEPKKAQVHFAKLNAMAPVLELFLLPLDHPAGEKKTLALRGTMPGITEIDAVPLNEIMCSVKEYEEKTRILTVINPHKIRLSKVCYGLLGADRARYEKFEAENDISPEKVQVKENFKGECVFNQTIARNICGQAEENGSYMIKVEDSENPLYLVRYVANQRICFQKVNFHQTDELAKGGGLWEPLS